MHLSEYMTSRNLSDEEVADAIKSTRPTISRIRRHLVRPSWKTIKKLESYSGGLVTASDFTNIETVE